MELNSYPLLSLHSIQCSQSLQEQAYQTLKQAILSGDLPADQRLVETQLAAKLQVSRTPIREALRLLQHDNLVTLGANGALANGALYVVSFSPKDAEQLYDCRMALEQQSIWSACQNATDEQIHNLDLILEQARHLHESEPTHLCTCQMLDLASQFHRSLAQSSGNLWLVSLLDQVFDKMQLLRIQTIKSSPKVLDNWIEHRQIYEAIVARNPEAAVQIMQAHLLANKSRIVQELHQVQHTSEHVE